MVPGGRQHPAQRQREMCTESRAVADPGHVWTHLTRKPGDPVFAREPTHSGRSGSLRTEADDERTREVGQARSTGEVPEQGRNSGGGGDGGKGSGQREPATAKRVPDTEPGRRAECAGAGTASCKKGQGNEVHYPPA